MYSRRGPGRLRLKLTNVSRSLLSLLSVLSLHKNLDTLVLSWPTPRNLKQETNDQKNHPDRGKTRLTLFITHVRKFDVHLIVIVSHSRNTYCQCLLSGNDQCASEHDRPAHRDYETENVEPFAVHRTTLVVDPT